MKKKILDPVNIFSIACLLFAVGYLYFNFTSLRQAVLFLACIFLLYYSPVLFNGLLRKMLLDENGTLNTLKYYRVNISLLLLSAGLIYFLGNWQLLSAIATGCLMFFIFFVIYYSLKRKVKNI